jgi:hypothetical protein
MVTSREMISGAVSPTYAVVPSGGRACLNGCLESLLPQVDTLFLVRTGEFVYEPLGSVLDSKICFIDDIDPPKNISRWWNRGIAAAAAYATAFHQSEWNVLVVNDDVVACPQLTTTLDAAMRRRQTEGRPCDLLRGQSPVLAYPDNYPPHRRTEFHTAPGQVQLSTRISGWCFMLRGESNLQADEQFEWFYGDDDLDWRAREQGGAVMVPDCPVEHLSPGKLTAESVELTARTHVDRQLFHSKWSALPH